jgi:hypothetical protein
MQRACNFSVAPSLILLCNNAQAKLLREPHDRASVDFRFQFKHQHDLGTQVQTAVFKTQQMIIQGLSRQSDPCANQQMHPKHLSRSIIPVAVVAAQRTQIVASVFNVSLKIPCLAAKLLDLLSA